MGKPTIAARQPAIVQLQAGEIYHWCSCGQSRKQPFCDGSHQGTLFEPQPFAAAKDETVRLCRCKYSVNSPFCDCSHDLPLD